MISTIQRDKTVIALAGYVRSIISTKVGRRMFSKQYRIVTGTEYSICIKACI